MGDAAPSHGFESAAAVLERGLDTLLDKFNANVEERIAAAVDSGLQKIAEEKYVVEAANAASERTIATMQGKIDGLAATVARLQRELAEVKLNKDNATDEGAAGARRNPTKRTTPAPNKDDSEEWTMGLKWDPTWTWNKKKWYKKEIKVREPERAKAEYREWLKKRLAQQG